MPTYYRRYGRYRRYKRRYGYKRASGFYRSYRNTKRTWKASTRGTKSTTIAMEWEYQLNVQWQANALFSNVISFCPSALGLNTTQACLSNIPLYKTYASLYDKCKVESMKMSFALSSSLLGAQGNYCTFITCLDRHGSTGEAQNVTPQSVYQSSSALKTMFTTNQKMIAYRSAYASSFLERNTWADVEYDDTNSIPDLEDQENAFCPLVHMTLWAAAASASAVTVPIRVSVKYTVRFMNPRGAPAQPAIESKRKVPYDDEDDEDVILHDELSKMSTDSQTTTTTPVYVQKSKTRR